MTNIEIFLIVIVVACAIGIGIAIWREEAEWAEFKKLFLDDKR